MRAGPILLDRRRGQPTTDDRWVVTRTPTGAVADSIVAGVVLRRDHFDPQGRLLRTDIVQPRYDGKGNLVSDGTRGPAIDTKRCYSLLYERDATGVLRRILKVFGSLPPRPARHDLRNPQITARDLRLMSPLLERHEVLLLLGQPVTHSVDMAAGAQRTQDSYAQGCWLNELSVVNYDAAGVVSHLAAGCICGFCVDARAPIDARAVVGIDLHWNAGPWFRLDDRLDITGDHPVLTPSGPRPAGSLRSGDRVLGADGSPWQPPRPLLRTRAALCRGTPRAQRTHRHRPLRRRRHPPIQRSSPPLPPALEIR